MIHGASHLLYYFSTQRDAFVSEQEEIAMKRHRFWAWGAVICMVMVMITGYKHK